MAPVNPHIRLFIQALRPLAASTVLMAAGILLLLPAPAGAATVNVTIKDNSFSPKAVTINVGDTVLWTNQGANTHTATSGSGCTANGMFDSGNMESGGTFSFTFTAAGSVPYFCRIHCGGGMTGTITVQSSAALSCTATASPLTGPAPLTVAFAATASGGTAPYTFLWNFGDDQTSTASTIAHTYAAAGTYSWTFTVTDSAGGSCQSDNLIVVAAVTPQAFLASAARASGAQGTNWRTDAMFYNAGTADLAFVLYYTPAGADGTATPYSHAGVLTPGTASLLSNCVETLFGLTNSAGGIRILASGPLEVTSRTYNDTGNGTYGQFAPGQAEADAIGAASVGELIGLNQNDRFRTNLGFSEVAGAAVTVVVHFYDATGASLGPDVTFPLPPYSWSQQSLSQLGLPSASGVRAEVTVQGAGAVLAYASEVDNNTGDAIFMPAQKPADVAGVGQQLIATIAKAQGGFGTNWLTDLVLYNPAAATQTVSLQYTASQGTFPASFTLTAGEVRTVTDAVAALFPGAGSSTAGALHLTSGQGLLLASRTYNQASPTQTYGQYVPALAEAALIASGSSGDILQVTQNADFRTNIGLSDFSGAGASVQVALYDLQGNRIGLSDLLTVPPGGNLQQAIGLMFSHSPLFDAGRAVVTVLSGGPIYGYASVVDNRTGDAVFIPAKH